VILPYAVMLVGMVRGMVIMRTLSTGTAPLTDTAPEMVRVFLHGAAAAEPFNAHSGLGSPNTTIVCPAGTATYCRLSIM
jgi:hypothetical protein